VRGCRRFPELLLAAALLAPAAGAQSVSFADLEQLARQGDLPRPSSVRAPRASRCSARC
jgi:hypothetical protein